jgi:hypothetical protein
VFGCVGEEVVVQRDAGFGAVDAFDVGGGEVLELGAGAGAEFED